MGIRETSKCFRPLPDLLIDVDSLIPFSVQGKNSANRARSRARPRAHMALVLLALDAVPVAGGSPLTGALVAW
jgi:hypothetical protein